jgi:hypothetical protein
MNKKLQQWEHEGWVGVAHRDVLRCVAAELKARKAPTFYQVVAPGTPARTKCRLAAAKAKRAVRASSTEEWDMRLPQGMALPGLSLQGNCQKYFYRAIREVKTKKLAPRVATVNKLELVKRAACDVFDRRVSEAEIWASFGIKDFLPRTAQFLWKNMHNAHRIGGYWTHIPECEERVICSKCGVLEYIKHILVNCECPGDKLAK